MKAPLRSRAKGGLVPRSIRVPAALAALVLILTLWTAPAAHAAGTGHRSVGPGDWLALLWHHLAGGWPGSSGSPPTALLAPEGGMMDPNGAPQTLPPEGSHMDPDGTPGAPAGSQMDPNGGASPTAGGDMDPNG